MGSNRRRKANKTTKLIKNSWKTNQIRTKEWRAIEDTRDEFKRRSIRWVKIGKIDRSKCLKHNGWNIHWGKQRGNWGQTIMEHGSI